MDVKTAFLYGKHHRDVYVEQPAGYIVGDPKTMKWKLNSSLYGTVDAGHEWNDVINDFLLEKAFIRNKIDPCLYHRYNENLIIIITLYVDDLTITGDENIESIQTALEERFEMKRLGEVKKVIGLEVNRKEMENGADTLTITHSNYIREMGIKFNQTDGKYPKIPMDIGISKRCVNASHDENEPALDPTTPYRELVGSLMYCAVNVRGDISNAVRILSSNVEKPKQIHWEAAKSVLRYLLGTVNKGLVFTRLIGIDMQDYINTFFGFADASHATASKARGVTGVAIFFGSACVLHRSVTQPIAASSTMESEIIALSLASKEIVALKEMMKSLLNRCAESPIAVKHSNFDISSIACDNQAAIKTVNHVGVTTLAKHVLIKFFNTRDLVRLGFLSVGYCPTEDQVSDILTKQLTYSLHCRMTDLLLGYESVIGILKNLRDLQNQGSIEFPIDEDFLEYYGGNPFRDLGPSGSREGQKKN
jgi:hypothetical protein